MKLLLLHDFNNVPEWECLFDGSKITPQNLRAVLLDIAGISHITSLALNFKLQKWELGTQILKVFNCYWYSYNSITNTITIAILWCLIELLFLEELYHKP